MTTSGKKSAFLFWTLPIITGALLYFDTAGRAEQSKMPVDTAKVAAAGTEFGFDLLGKLANFDGNVFVSPFSIAQALSLTLNGAGGETRKQISETLHLGDMPLSDVNAANSALLAQLRSPEPDVTMSIANAIWVNNGLKLDPEFRSRCTEFYGAASETLDFSSPESAGRINKWVSEQTKGNIKEITNPEVLKDYTTVLTNAVYFHGRWSKTFDSAVTQPETFTLGNGKTKQVPMMRQTGSFSYLKSDDFQLIRIPYGKGRTAMYIVLPSQNLRIDDLLTEATADRWSDLIGQMQPASLQLKLPRFSASQDVNLKQPLSDLGMAGAFGAGADFGPMGIPGSYIGAVLHKATLDVNETGSTAAAATAVAHSAGIEMPPPIQFTVDHPFLCAIRDDTTGTLLFIGAIRDPK